MRPSRQIEIEVPFPYGVIALFETNTIKVGMSHTIPGGVLRLEPIPMQKRTHDLATLVPVIVAIGNVVALATYLCRQLRNHKITQILMEHEEVEVTTPEGIQRKIKDKMRIERKE